MFNYGLNLTPRTNPLGFSYGEGTFGPTPEIRTLNAIRPSLRNPNCDGPEELYGIIMDAGRNVDRIDLETRHLLFGVVTYAAGKLGEEPIRSQGHIHKRSPRNDWSTPEVYEIWQGRAVILMQEFAGDNAGRCFAVEAGPGEVVVVPPCWAHATISADPEQPLTFGAWCDRAYGFEYGDVRAHGGLAWFPILTDEGTLRWEANDKYEPSKLITKAPADYSALGIEKRVAIYPQYIDDRSRFDFVPNPEEKENVWKNFTP